jgi:hypothetical protein
MKYLGDELTEDDLSADDWRQIMWDAQRAGDLDGFEYAAGRYLELAER